MNKRYLPYFAAVLLAFLIIAPGAAMADTNYTNVSASDAKKMIDEDNVFILDVRAPAEFEAAHIEGAVLIPLKNVPAHDPVILPNESLLPNRTDEVPTDKPVIVYCLTGGRSLNASILLGKDHKNNIYNMQGGIPAWIDERYSVESTFVDEMGLDCCLKKALSVKVDKALSYLEKGNNTKAEKELDKFTCFVNATEQAGRLNSSQANYSRLEAENIRHMM